MLNQRNLISLAIMVVLTVLILAVARNGIAIAAIVVGWLIFGFQMVRERRESQY